MEKARRPGLPVKPIATLFVMMFANAIVTTTPFPFLPFMVREFGFEPEDVGTQVHTPHVVCVNVGDWPSAWVDVRNNERISFSFALSQPCIPACTLAFIRPAPGGLHSVSAVLGQPVDVVDLGIGR